jgi:hypothetical protein
MMLFWSKLSLLIMTQAVSDIPCILFVDELLAAYPNAKVIITSRPVDRWLLSVENSFYAILSWKRWPVLELLDRVPCSSLDYSSVSDN